jgi:hypothetical protein
MNVRTVRGGEKVLPQSVDFVTRTASVTFFLAPEKRRKVT